jgi:hypothetical protein
LEVQAFSVFLAGLGRSRRAEGRTRRVWKVFEGPGVEPQSFPQKRSGNQLGRKSRVVSLSEIRILDSSGNVERTIPFNEANRKL